MTEQAQALKAVTDEPLTLGALKPHLQRCGYKGSLLQERVPLGENRFAPLVGIPLKYLSNNA